jgi:hypothetical protein
MKAEIGVQNEVLINAQICLIYVTLMSDVMKVVKC